MKALTAQEAREIVTQSHIYNLIAEKAAEGELSMTLSYMTRELFKILTKNGYRIFTEDETAEFTQYHEDLMNASGFCVISWEG